MALSDSSLLRRQGRQALRGHWQTALLVTFGAGIFSMALYVFQSRISFLSTDGQNLYSWMTAVQQQANQYSGLFAGLSLLSTVLTYALGIGLKYFYLQLHRGQEIGFSLLFSRMHIFGKCLGQALLVMLFVFLWSLILIPGVFLILVAGIYSMPVILVLFFLLLIPAFVAAYRYEMASYLLADNPEMGVMNSIRQSKKLMYCNKGRLFGLYFSFIGWYLLSAVITVALSWLQPILGTVAGLFASLMVQAYMHSSTAAFYLDLTGQTSQPEERKQGQVA